LSSSEPSTNSVGWHPVADGVPLLEQLVKLQPQNEELKAKLAAAKERARS
jgi:hypothetical protein